VPIKAGVTTTVNTRYTKNTEEDDPDEGDDSDDGIKDESLNEIVSEVKSKETFRMPRADIKIED